MFGLPTLFEIADEGVWHGGVWWGSGPRGSCSIGGKWLCFDLSTNLLKLLMLATLRS